MRRSFALLAVVVLALAPLLAPSGASPGGDERAGARSGLERWAHEEVARQVAEAATATSLAQGPRSAARPAAAEGQGDPSGFDADVEGGRPVPGVWVVALQPSTDPDQSDALARAAGGRAAERFEAVFPGFVFEGPAEAARRLAAHPRVRTVTADVVAQTTADSSPTGVRRIQADDARAGGRTGSGQRVAILDTGIDLDHPDLRDNIDAGRGTNCVDPGRSADDDNGHGTHVAGIVGAEADGSGVVGVAPEAEVVPVKVSDSQGRASFSDIICGIDHVVALGGAVRVINLSLSGASGAGSCTDGFLRQAVCEAVERGIVVVASAGNNDGNAGSQAPARYPEVLTVSALDDRDGERGGDQFASFSNYGSVVDLIAPGTNISSTGRGGGTTTKSGTSMAAPHVAGAAALALADGASSAGVRNRLLETGECPDGRQAGTDRTCSGQGSWSGDRDSTAEPLVNALSAGGAGGGGGGTAPPQEPPSQGGSGQGRAPTLSITSPGGGATVASSVSISADAEDAEDASQALALQYRIDGAAPQPMAHRKGDRHRATWDSTRVGDGRHTITVTATDGDGNATSASVEVTTDNGNQQVPPGEQSPGSGTGAPPTVALVRPDAGDAVDRGDKVALRAEASDGEDGPGDLVVEYRIDGAGPWRTMSYNASRDFHQATWSTAGLPAGSHSITARATDRAGNTSTAQPVEVRLR